MTAAITLLVVIAGMILLPYVLGPILIKSAHSQAANPVFREIDAQNEDVPREAKDFFEAGIPVLSEAGFTPLNCMEMSGYTSKAIAYFTLFAHRENRDLAMLTAFYVKLNDQLHFRTTYTEFVTRFADNRAVTTNNTGEITVTPKAPGSVKNSFPMIGEAQRLYRIHQALAKRESQGERKPPPQPGEAARMLTEGIAKEHAHAVEVGYLRFDSTCDVFRPTGKGACLMTWQLCWPIKSAIKSARVRKAEELLRELGL